MAPHPQHGQRPLYHVGLAVADVDVAVVETPVVDAKLSGGGVRRGFAAARTARLKREMSAFMVGRCTNYLLEVKKLRFVWLRHSVDDPASTV